MQIKLTKEEVNEALIEYIYKKVNDSLHIEDINFVRVESGEEYYIYPDSVTADIK